ncbi:hypothetical protein ACFL0D_07005 [Thermoproteota archaeon]
MIAYTPEITAIDFSKPTEEEVTAIFAGSIDGPQDTIITGSDALTWYSTAIWSDNLVFAVWPNPDASIIVYAGNDIDKMKKSIKNGTIILVAGGGLGKDVPYVVGKRVATPPELVEFFGIEHLVVSSEEPVTAAVRRLGHPDDVAEQLSLLGATVTIFARAPSAIAQILVGHIPSSLTLKQVKRTGPNLITRVAWTRALGAFQVNNIDSLQNIKEVLEGSLGPSATIIAQTEIAFHINKILGAGTEEYDIIATAQPGGITCFITDLTKAFTDVGPVILTGQAVPPRPVIVLRGQIADRIRSDIQLNKDASTNGAPLYEEIVFGPPPTEDKERFIAHQWARVQRRAEEARSEDWSHGGPTLVSEAKSIGLLDTIKETEISKSLVWDDIREPSLVDTSTLKDIAYARDWHFIDLSLPPVLDSVIKEARQQIIGKDESITSSSFEQLKAWSSDPGFWNTLYTAILPVKENDDFLVFPYPPVAIDLLRAVVAAEGNAKELRRLIGPLKVTIMSPLLVKPGTSENEKGPQINE